MARIKLYPYLDGDRIRWRPLRGRQPYPRSVAELDIAVMSQIDPLNRPGVAHLVNQLIAASRSASTAARALNQERGNLKKIGDERASLATAIAAIFGLDTAEPGPARDDAARFIVDLCKRQHGTPTHEAGSIRFQEYEPWLGWFGGWAGPVDPDEVGKPYIRLGQTEWISPSFEFEEVMGRDGVLGIARTPVQKGDSVVEVVKKMSQAAGSGYGADHGPLDRKLRNLSKEAHQAVSALFNEAQNARKHIPATETVLPHRFVVGDEVVLPTSAASPAGYPPHAPGDDRKGIVVEVVQRGAEPGDDTPGGTILAVLVKRQFQTTPYWFSPGDLRYTGVHYEYARRSAGRPHTIEIGGLNSSAGRYEGRIRTIVSTEDPNGGIDLQIEFHGDRSRMEVTQKPT